MPTTVPSTNSGPPESPWQASTPPSAYPAHTIVSGSNERNTSAQALSLTIGTSAACSRPGFGPFSYSLPQPTTVAMVPGSYSSLSALSGNRAAEADTRSDNVNTAMSSPESGSRYPGATQISLTPSSSPWRESTCSRPTTTRRSDFRTARAQCAAVRTSVGEITAPPQYWSPRPSTRNTA